MKTQILTFVGLSSLSSLVRGYGPISDNISCEFTLNGADCVNYPYETCQILKPETDGEVIENQSVCFHKELRPVLAQEIFPTILLPFLVGLASVAGVGGGLVIVPITIGFFNFSSKEAIAISTALVFETALIRFIFFSAWTKHPEAP